MKINLAGLPFLFAITIMACPAHADQLTDFTDEINVIRGLQGSVALKWSTALYELTGYHALEIRKHGCDLLKKDGLSVSALGKVSTVYEVCNGEAYRLVSGRAYSQSVKDEAWSLAYRVDNGGLFAVGSTSVAVSLVTCGGSQTVVVATAE